MDHSKPNFFYDLKDDVVSQAKLNPDFFVMPCNTAHYFYDDLAALTDVPFLHMMRIAVHKFVDDFPSEEKIGLIATEGSIYDHLYVDELERVGKKVELGGPEIQPMVNELIYSDIKEKGIVDHDLYHKILKTMHDKYGCKVILLGCTELSLAQEKLQTILIMWLIRNQLSLMFQLNLLWRYVMGWILKKLLQNICINKDKYLSALDSWEVFLVY